MRRVLLWICLLVVSLMSLPESATAQDTALTVGTRVRAELTAQSREVRFTFTRTAPAGEYHILVIQAIPTVDSSLSGLVVRVLAPDGTAVADSSSVTVFGRSGVLMAYFPVSGATDTLVFTTASENASEGAFDVLLVESKLLTVGTPADATTKSAALNDRIFYDSFFHTAPRDGVDTNITFARTGEISAVGYAPSLIAFTVDVGGSLVPEAFAGGSTLRRSVLTLSASPFPRVFAVGDSDFGGYGVGESESAYTVQVD